MREQVRRIVISVVAFLVLTGGGVLAAGVSDTSHLQAGPLPASFRMAEPRVGDSGTYVWDRVQVGADGLVHVLNEHEILGFEWLPPTSVADWTGARHDALMLHQWGWQTRDNVRGPALASVAADGWERYAEPVYAIDAGSDQILSYSYLSEATANPDQHQQGRSAQRMFVTPGERFGPECGAFPAYGGRNVPLDRSVDLQRACLGLTYFVLADPHAPMHAVGTQTLGDHETLLFSSGDGGSHVWYNDSIPFPLRVAVPVCDFPAVLLPSLLCKQDQFDVLRLASFHRGDTPLPDRPTSPSPPTFPAPAWDVKPLKGGLPDETGVEHPFPASQALAAARRDPNATTFRDVVDHGYVTDLSYYETLDNASSARTWTLSAYDGEHSASVRVEKRIDARVASTPPLPIPLLPPTSTGSPAPTTTLRVTVEKTPSAGPWPAPADAPTTAPTVASMWTRWRGFASREYDSSSPNAWGLRIDCLGTDRSSKCMTYVERSAGVQRSETSSAGHASLMSVLRESDHAGRGHEMTLSEWADEARATAETPLEMQTSAAPGSLSIIKSTAWVTPATQVVVRSAFVAGLLSVTYLVWPTLRAGAMVLYTRNTTPPAALRNAQRQRMLATIQAKPGITVPDLARALSRRRSPTEHHLAMLHRVGLVRIEREGAKRRVFACDADPAANPHAPALSSDVARRILEARRADPTLTVRQAARTFDVSPGTVSYHLARLRASHLLSE